MPKPRRRIYSETLSYRELLVPRTIELLRRFELELVLAVQPHQRNELLRVALALRDSAIPLSIWPMLSDDAGRWASVHNAREFREQTLALVDGLEKADARPRDVLFDVEPPFAQAQSLVRLAGSRASEQSRHGPLRRRAAFAVASSTLASTVSDLRARGITTSMAVWPVVLLDPPRAPGWQSFLGTPVDALGADHVSAMMYSSMLEGWSRGLLRRPHAMELLERAANRAVLRWGAKAGISLGCVGPGAFEDEPVFRSPTELAFDVSIAQRAGCDDLSLFDLGGVLSRGPSEAWLEAFCGAHPVRADIIPSRRIRAARALARGVTWALGGKFRSL